MRSVFAGLLIGCLMMPAAWAKSALDLMLEGRYGEAKAILDKTVASPRYQLIYFALTESEAARACSLYQVIAIRYPNTDCDSVARARLDMAREMGVVVVPINEWAEAPAGVKPLGIRRAAPPPPPSVVEAKTTTASVDTIVHHPATAAIVDTTQVAQADVMREQPAEKAVDLTVSFAKEEKADTIKPVAEPPKTIAPAVTETPPQVVPHDTVVVAKPEAKSEPQTPTVPPAVNKEEVAAPVVIAPKVAPPVETAKPVVKEPEIAAPKPAAPPSPPVAEKTAPAESLKAVKVEPAKPVADTLAAKASVKLTKPLLSPHDKPMATPGQWFIQVGAFANFDNAHRLATTLQKAGYPIKLVPRETTTKKLLQVRVGGYAAHDDCVPVADELKSKYQVPAVIISE